MAEVAYTGVMLLRLLVLVTLTAAAAACPAPTTSAEPTPDDGDGLVEEGTPPRPVQVGDWSSYAEPEEAEWPTEPLDDARWAVVSAELACAARANHGDPDAQRKASRKILAHHETTGPEVMEHGIAVNADPEKALKMGEAVAAATEACR